MALRILSGILLLVALFMGIKQGWAMVSGKPEMLEFFHRFGFGKTAVFVNGIVTLIAAVLLLFPKTFVIGNFLMAAGILLILCLELFHKDIKGAGIELPFLTLNLILLYLQHPFQATVFE